MRKSAYRPDIDGLRAVAVLFVVIYHANFNFFSGGFVGVDVFFVISGFLITNLIVNDVDGNCFSLTKFYERRIRRILPALYFLVLCILLVGYFIILPEDYLDLAKSATAVLAFVSNFYMAKNTGYFDGPAESKLFLHTWSLSVEEQFYFFFPVFILLVSRYFKSQNLRTLLISVVTILSLVWSQMKVSTNANGAFYFLPSRAWELLAGSLIFLQERRISKSKWLYSNITSLVGLALIFYGGIAYSAQTQFPGFRALAPVLGAMLVIIGGFFEKNLVSNFLGLNIFTGIGKISYSLYLWHWPFFVLLKYLYLWPTSFAGRLAVIASAFFMSFMSWKFIEQPIRNLTIDVRKEIFKYAAAATACLAGICGVVIFSKGFSQRITVTKSVEEKSFETVKKRCLAEKGGKICSLGDSLSPESTFFWGDSHLLSLAYEIEKIAKKNGKRISVAVAAGCPPLFNVSQHRNGYDRECIEFGRSVLDYLRSHKVDRVVMFARWSIYVTGERFGDEGGNPVLLRGPASTSQTERDNESIFREGFSSTLRELKEMKKKVVIFGPTPEVGWDVPRRLSIQKLINTKPPEEVTVSGFQRRNKAIIGMLSNSKDNGLAEIEFLDKKLCDDRFCKYQNRDEPYYYDTNHLSVAGAMLFSDVIEKVIN
ncbi:MAG: hypothetical protein A4S09_00365 [Proteobacteria bacterium SG_bin7]|nr:MAG: hypothetical protein A4S09_00365 [Proteobacteria bacterium SG_bin7]